MKKTLLLLFALMVFSLSASAQHIKFMGVPLSGTVNAFSSKMMAKGFTIDTKFENGNIMMRGKFTNRDIELFLFGTAKTRQIYQVVVYYPKKDTWNALKVDYLNVKGLFDSKYELTSDYAFFIDPYDEGEGDEMEGVEQDKCRYVSFYDADGGSIIVQISKYRQVKLSYEDNINVEIAEREQ